MARLKRAEKDLSLVGTYERALDGEFKLLYVAPERLETSDFVSFAAEINISMVTVDEAHCITQWGQDFRPSYLKITDFIADLKRRPVVSAFTATATKLVRDDIRRMLAMRDSVTVATGFDRPNLFFAVETPKNKDVAVLDYIHAHPHDSGIIYCATRKNVDNLHKRLHDAGIRAVRYHAGMTAEDRAASQADFICDRAPVIVATNAFGMGIDKSDVRYVIHYNMPQNLENYYQEAGRAGRDGDPAECIVLFAQRDIMINKTLLLHNEYADVTESEEWLCRQRDNCQCLTGTGLNRHTL